LEDQFHDDDNLLVEATESILFVISPHPSFIPASLQFVFTARCYAERCTVLRRQVVCPSDRLWRWGVV